MALVSGSESCADDPSSWWPLHKSYYKQPILGGRAHHQVPLFTHRVIWVGQQNRQWVAERGNRFVKRDAMFAKIFGRLLGIPFELLGHGGECNKGRT